MYRTLKTRITPYSHQVLLLLGPRQVGKTTLLTQSFPDATYLNLEEQNYAEIFQTRNLDKIQSLMCREANRDANTWILDEVQRLPDPGLVAKVIHDSLPHIRLILSGSSALEIATKASESLAGRKRTFHLYPLSFQEYLIQSTNGSLPKAMSHSILPNYAHEGLHVHSLKYAMEYGLYPELLNIPSVPDKEAYLLELVDSIILKDIFYLNLIKNTKVIFLLLRLLAYQIGNQINISELASRLGIARPTVSDYLELLKKSYIIYTLSPYTKRRRDEIGKTEKVYFYDMGIRNAIINDFSPVEFRRDYGAIFENFVITELIKRNQYEQLRQTFYYWKTKWGSEVDLVLVKDNQYTAIEIKTRKRSITSAFRTTYPETQEHIITMENAGEILQ